MLRFRPFVFAMLMGLSTSVPVASALAQSAQVQVAQALGEVPSSREQIKLSYAPVVRQVSPAVVNIYTRTVIRSQPIMDPFFNRFFGMNGPNGATRDRVQNALGSGVIIAPNGTIVTNHHVVDGANEITVVLADHREFEAKVLGSDERSDLAVLKIDTKGERLPSLSFGDSDALEVGDLVLAIGNPYGFSQSVTSGIVSALSRSKGPNDYGTFIQTDAAINPGNSGGALVNMAGQLVGINSWIASPTGSYVGIGFAIPSSLVKAVLNSITSVGKVVHPYVGLAGQAVTQEIAQSLKLPHPGGVLISHVIKGGPAAQAGIEVGDVVTAVNGKVVDDPEAMRFRLATLPVGSAAHLTVMRKGVEKTLDVPLIAPPETPPRDVTELKGRTPLSGATVSNLNPAADEEYGMPADARGVAIIQLRNGSTAQRLQFQPGDMILGVNGVQINSVADLRSALEAPAGMWQIKLNRDGDVLTVAING